MSRICTICARRGSKGVPGKNARLLNGRPLVEYTIEQAQVSGCFDQIAVSTDDPAIMDIARSMGLSMILDRPARLASDEAGKVDVIAHCVRSVETRVGRTFTTIVDLDVTSPLRHVQDIVAAIALLEQHAATNVISGAPARRSPYFNLVELSEAGYVRLSKPLQAPLTRRQDAPRCFDMNASVYAWRRDAFMADPRVFYEDTLLYEMPEDRSLDIDSELDWQIVEFLQARRTA